MISLKIDNVPVDLPDDFSVTINMKSPVFNDIGSYSYPFQLPKTPKNSIIFGFRHRIPGTGSIYSDFPGTCYWKDIPLFSGTVKINTLTDNAFEVYLLEGNGYFNYHRKNDMLQDVDYGDIIYFANLNEKLAYINACKNTVYPERIMTFPMIHNKSYFDELPADPLMLYFNYYLQSYINSVDPGTSNRMVIVPMLYLRYVLKKIFEHLAYAFDDSFFDTDSSFNSLVLYNSVDCNSGFSGYFQYSDWDLVPNYHVPRISMNDFFSGLESFLNVRFFVNNVTRTIKLIQVNDIINTQNYVEFSHNLISQITEPEEQIRGFHLKMSMDTDDETYTAGKEIQDKFLQSFKQPVQRISDLKQWPLSDYLDIRWVFDENAYYVLQNNNSWQRADEEYFDPNLISEFIYKKDDQSLESKFSTLLLEKISPFNAVVGSAMADWRTTSPKLFFSLYTDNGYYDQKQVRSPKTYTSSLLYPGEAGLLNKYFKSYFDFKLSTKLIKIVKLMTFSDLKDFDFSKKYMINGTKYLVKSIQVVLKKDRIMPATLECYVCSI